MTTVVPAPHTGSRFIPTRPPRLRQAWSGSGPVIGAEGPEQSIPPALPVGGWVPDSQVVAGRAEEDGMQGKDVVVGVDGSASSRMALRWAAAEAALRGLRLRIAHAYRPPWLIEEVAAGASLDEAALANAQRTMADSIEEARTVAPGSEVIGTTACCHPVPLLIENAGRSGLIVVGSHGRGGFGSVLLGSTGLQLAMHATAPVVIVRGHTDHGNAPVVVGTDGSEQADVAVGAAFDTAAARGCYLTAVHAFHRVPAGSADDQHAAAEATLRTALQPWREKYPAVPVETVATPGDAASVLTTLSTTAQLMVVGTRGRGGFAGLLLGSVGQKLIHHAHCPVLIARGTPTAAGNG
jgi:nucleotide-binding universal stress UspA family protein